MVKSLHQKNSWIRDLILGGQDGLVNVLGIILGVTAANGTHPVIVAASLAAAFAEAVSMGAVNYTSTLAERDHYAKEKNTEYWEIEHEPDEEREEIRAIYSAKGFKGRNLEMVVNTITQNKDNWAKVMMDEELKLQEVRTDRIFSSSFLVGFSTVVGSIIPVLPYFVFQPNQALPISLVLSSVVLFSVGVYKAKTYVGNWWKSGLQMLLIGMGAAIIGFIIGKFFRVD
ncbi:MAG: VIT1/CCC1 transporter family protein [Candidatus Microgenomates bacterium]